MAGKKESNPVITVSFDRTSPEAMDALSFIKTFKRGQGKFITALVMWYLSFGDSVYYDKNSEKIIDISDVIYSLQQAGVDDTAIAKIRANPSIISQSTNFISRPEIKPSKAGDSQEEMYPQNAHGKDEILVAQAEPDLTHSDNVSTDFDTGNQSNSDSDDFDINQMAHFG